MKATLVNGGPFTSVSESTAEYDWSSTDGKTAFAKDLIEMIKLAEKREHPIVQINLTRRYLIKGNQEKATAFKQIQEMIAVTTKSIKSESKFFWHVYPNAWYAMRTPESQFENNWLLFIWQ